MTDLGTRPAPGAGPRATQISPRRVLVISGSVGAGHDGAARELADRLRRAGTAVEVRDLLDAVPRWLAWVLRDGYLATSRHCPAAFEAMFRAAEDEGFPLRLFRLAGHLGAPRVRRWVADGRFDAVVSTYPVASQAVGELRAAGACPVPALTYVTDPAVHRAWVHPAVDAHLAVTATSAAQGTRDHGVEFAAAGPLAAAAFTGGEPGRRQQLRRQLSLPDDRPVVLLGAGSYGVGDVEASAKDLAAEGLHALVLCGHNTRLARRLRSAPGITALGWRTDVPDLMHASDVLVHNAGGLTLTEALVAGLPAVTYRPIPGHGRANAAALQASGLAPWARDRSELTALIRRQLAAGTPPVPPGDPTTAVLELLADHEIMGLVS